MKWPWRRRPGQPEVPAAPARPRGEWRRVRAIQLSVAEPPLVNPVDRFSASLASWQDPRLLAPLGHAVGDAEPSGVIDGLAHLVPGPRAAAAASFPQTSEDRTPGVKSSLPGAGKGGMLGGTQPAALSSEVLDGHATGQGGTLSRSEEPGTAPAAATLPAAATPDPAPPAAVQRTADPPPLTARPLPPAPSRQPDPPPALPPPAPLAAAPVTSPPPQSDPPQATPARDDSSPPALPLAAPLPDDPPPAAPLLADPPRAAPPPADPPLLAAPAPVRQQADPRQADLQRAAVPSPPHPAGAVPDPVPLLDPAPTTPPMVSSLPAPVPRRLGLGAPLPMSSLDSPAQLTVARLVGDYPPAAQRQPEPSAEPIIALPSTPPVPPPLDPPRPVFAPEVPLTVPRPDGELPLPAVPLNAPPEGPPPLLAVARLVGERPPALVSRPTAVPAAGPSPPATAPAAPQPAPSSRSPAPAPPVPGWLTVARAVTGPAAPAFAASRAAAGPSLRPEPGPLWAASTSAPAAEPYLAPVQRQETITASADIPPADTLPADTPPADATPVVTAAPAATVPAAVAPPAGGQPDELVAKLFDPLLRRLKAELRMDRDRRGSLTDLRR